MLCMGTDFQCITFCTIPSERVVLDKKCVYSSRHTTRQKIVKLISSVYGQVGKGRNLDSTRRSAFIVRRSDDR